jgi:hypothetical protein
MPQTFDLLQSTTTTTNTTTITFSSIPATYLDLVLVCRYKHASLTSNSLSMRFNGDSGNNYSFTYAYDDGTKTNTGRNVNYNYAYVGWFTTPGTTEGATAICHINDYASTNAYKSWLSRNNSISSNTSYAGVEQIVGSWMSTSAINQIQIYRFME